MLVLTNHFYNLILYKNSKNKNTILLYLLLESLFSRLFTTTTQKYQNVELLNKIYPFPYFKTPIITVIC